MGSMEEISAACAVSWSIELEKGLRSKKPGRLVESINQIGPRLKRWSEESQLTMPLYNMFGLVPGEDKLFADAIFLRLADAFVSGDKVTRTSVIKVFLSTRKHYKTKDGQAHGIFSNMSTGNKLELLRRVKGVLSADCVESRALTLVLLGCWADIAEDVAEIRYAILSTLISFHILEVKGALFAAGCFSEVSDDFGSVFLEKLLNFLASPKSSLDLKIAGARALSKIGHSTLLAIKSYKAGAELVQNLFEEDILVAMLISLTKLSCRAGIFIPEQVGLLCSVTAQNTSLHIQATVLRCMRYIGERAACLVPISAFQTLFRMFDEANLPSALRCDILQICHKMLAYALPGMQHMEINEVLKKLFRYIEDATRSPFLSERLLAFEVLVCVSSKLKRRSEVMFEGNSVTCLSGVVSALCDQIIQLMSPVSGDTENSGIELELGSILKSLLVLVENHSELGYIILDKLQFVIENTVNSHSMPAVAVVHKVVDAGAEENKFSVRKFMFLMYRFLVIFLENFDTASGATDQVVCRIKHLVSFVCGSSLFDCSIHTLYTLLHSSIKWGCLSSENLDTGNYVQGKGKSHWNLLQCEAVMHECVENMLAGGDTWYAYRAGKYAFCAGVSHIANFIFQRLEKRVQSDFCCQWLKFLIQFTHTEKNIQVLLQQACLPWPLGCVSTPYVVDNGGRDIMSSEFFEKLIGACDGISTSKKMLEAISIRTQTLCFQRWFLSIRVKVLLVWVDVLKLSDTCLSCKDNMESISVTDGSHIHDGNPQFQKIKGMRFSLGGISSRLTRLAEECDLIASSFIDMDSKSFRGISALAFCCSLLAFCAGFINLMGDPFLSQNLIELSSDSNRILIHDLVGRLWHSDPETCVDLMSILKGHEMHGSSLHFLPRFQISKVGFISEEFLKVCRSSVKGMVGLVNDYLSVHNKYAASRVCEDGLRILLDVLAAWMHIPFRIPKYFFRVRPTLGSMLIYSSTGSAKQNKISISIGSHLALNLCIQLKHVPSDVYLRFTKIYCILYCKPSPLVSSPNAGLSGVMQTGYEASNTDMMIGLNKKLQSHVLKQTGEFMPCRDSHSGGAVEACVCFQTNGSLQGFSSCLLDVSSFPVGSYRVQWHTGGIDDQGVYQSILPLSPGPLFFVEQPSSMR